MVFIHPFIQCQLGPNPGGKGLIDQVLSSTLHAAPAGDLLPASLQHPEPTFSPTSCARMGTFAPSHPCLGLEFGLRFEASEEITDGVRRAQGISDARESISQ